MIIKKSCLKCKYGKMNYKGSTLYCKKYKEVWLSYVNIDEPNKIWSDLTESKNSSLNKLMSEACKHHG
jgi:hypothetical protein